MEQSDRSAGFAPHLRGFSTRDFLNDPKDPAAGRMSATPKSRRDHRPRMPEVALRLPPGMASHFSVKSVFGRPRRLATSAAAEQFMVTHYRRFGGQKACPAPLPTVPPDSDQQLRARRRRLRLTQDALARRIRAACKAVVYQWESRKRTPSPVLWQQVLGLLRDGARTVNARAIGPGAIKGASRPVANSTLRVLYWSVHDPVASRRQDQGHLERRQQ
jgi:DNA-binding transcriptional regulator YiaG